MKSKVQLLTWLNDQVSGKRGMAKTLTMFSVLVVIAEMLIDIRDLLNKEV